VYTAECIYAAAAMDVCMYVSMYVLVHTHMQRLTDNLVNDIHIRSVSITTKRRADERRVCV
jgi:hypothetical protein